jgi:hypothetical protein
MKFNFMKIELLLFLLEILNFFQSLFLILGKNFVEN